MTAVEFLIKELNLEGYDYTIELAKQMEKEQILQFAISSVSKAINEDIQNPFNLEQHYKETYESNINI